MTALRILNAVVWIGMIAFMLPGAWHAAFGHDTRRGDPMRLACLSTAFFVVGFNLRAMFAPTNMWLLIALYIVSAADGIYIIALAHAYGRGGRV